MAVYGIVGLVTAGAPELGVAIGTSILGGLCGLGLGVVTYDDDHGVRMSEERQGRRVAIMIAGGIVLVILTWAMSYPPLCFLGDKYCK